MPEKITEKKCSMCRKQKPLDEFHRRVINGTNTGQGYCIPCGAIYTRMWQKRNPDKVRGYEQRRKAKQSGTRSTSSSGRGSRAHETAPRPGRTSTT